ncbi:N-acetylmuramic acid 6-phosphate etherase [Sulfitobacter sp. D35]|uniref:N-acetylmuramic acid 6-phosphate etherase n=1 Tax=Sulfitobacter sp. D35 TaxID=3083252 RepID=UPI00296F10EF|nr:N-acetylmuramic acid 6-phosphate etherase [Sulfitobacter sp. D35]MDW4498479.1 N-acetylmuramic acid 6-phosphate etherase [Sulfitobacter sp. D35]
MVDKRYCFGIITGNRGFAMQPTTPSAEENRPLDDLPRTEALRRMLDSQVAAARCVAGAIAEIDHAADAVAAAVAAGRRLHYAAAGSSGLMALSDASELAGTFGIPSKQVRIAMAGGVPVDARMPGDTEDGTDEARDAASGMKPGDVALVLSASGTTPFACAFAESARAKKAKVIAIANVARAPMLDLADIAISIPTAPEVIGGSTRLGAGTAQKIALNMISTQAGILLGHVHDGMMVNLVADNAKLRQRASGIVQRIAGVSEDAASNALSDARNDTKRAVLLASGASPEAAERLLAETGGRLRDCLAALRANDKTTN